MIQQVVVFVIVGLAALLVLRSVWREVDGFIHPDRAGSCPGCGMCDAAKADSKRTRSAPQAKVVPLVQLDITRRRH